ncbi:MAG: hypothetical protein HY554_06865 [Elusimicrobia bacterium]|nr:hypothetical protein [Elusimicrobiota bacterium]
MTRLAETRLRSLSLQGHYPTLRSLLAGQECRDAAARDKARLPGSSQPFVAYQTEDGRRGRLEVRDQDLLLLAHGRPEEVAEHCGLVLRARSGDGDAAAAVEARAGGLSRLLRDIRGRADRAESPCLVPSTSERRHAADQVSHKGEMLLKLSRLGYPVPDFVILTAGAYERPEEEQERLAAAALETLASMTGRQAGLSQAPLVFALRCAMPSYYPGVMPTFLNVGVTRPGLPALEAAFGRQAALKMHVNNLRNLLAALDRELYDSAARRFRADLPEAELGRTAEWAAGLIARIDGTLLDDPLRQTRFFIRQGYRYFEDNQDLLLTLGRGRRQFPALILQQMVCTVRGTDSYAGVLFSRHSRTGAGLQLETARSVFGEEIMTGDLGTEHTSFEDPEQVREAFPCVHHFLPKLPELEQQLEGPAMLEFAVESAGGRQLFALLQANVPGMTGRAALIAVTDLHQAGAVSRRRVTELICPYHIKQIESDTIDPESIPAMARFCSGVAILPRAAVSAKIYFSAEAAIAGKRRGEKVCYCKRSFGPGDTVVMQEMDAILSLTSAAIHVVTICQTFGSPSLLSLDKDGVRLLEDEGCLVSRSGERLREGAWITISSRRQALFTGRARFKPARLLGYMRGESVRMAAEEKPVFDALAYAYRYYQRLVRGLELDQIARLNELVRIVNLDLRGAEQEARTLINGWYDAHERGYVDEIFNCEMGDHLNQHRVFSMLTVERQTRFFQAALERCARERRSGYTAGAFMLGRFLSTALPAAFWRALEPASVALAANEWVLFEKYLQVLFDVGERHVSRARKTILRAGLGAIPLSAARVRHLLPARLAGADLERARAAVPDWADPQAGEALELLRRPYSEHFDPADPAAAAAFRRLCDEAGAATRPLG